VHSITHKGPEEWWGKNATIEDWFDEMVGQANIINRSDNYWYKNSGLPIKITLFLKYLNGCKELCLFFIFSCYFTVV
jgi:hypothetical protein